MQLAEKIWRLSSSEILRRMMLEPAALAMVRCPVQAPKVLQQAQHALVTDEGGPLVLE